MSVTLPTPVPISSSGPPTATQAAPTTSSAPTSSSSSSTPTSTSASTTNSISTTSSVTTSASSSAPTSSSTTSSSTTTPSSSSTSTTSSSTTSSTSIIPTPTPITVTSDGTVVVTYVTPVASESSTASSTNSTNVTTTNSFFQNTGAVAGVFTVVGLIVLVIFIALVTNAVRRRRAQKFDRDVAEAAAEAAATSRSPFDDYTSGGNSGYPYSDTTHGTFGQTPMGLPNDTYGMSEMSQYDPYAAGAASLAVGANVGRARSRLDSESRAPGIAGVGAGNLAREPSRKTPYHAFAGPSPQPHETMDHSASMRYRHVGMLEAAGLAGTGAAAMPSVNGGAYINRRPSQFTQQTHGSMRSHGHPSNENYPQPLQPGYQSPPRNDTQFPDAYTTNAPYPQRLPSPGPGFPIPHDASPSPPSHSQNHLIEGDDFHDDVPPAPLHEMHEDDRMSYADDDDYGQHNRVLRVANE